MDPPPEDDQRLKRKRPWEPEDDDPGAIPGRSRVADEQQRQDRSIRSMDDPVSECKHRIFLSHSGHDKDFVEELCGDLERCYRFPFFDGRSSSLPKGERFPELILAAARSCEVGVVVVSDEYFMSKWPMIELDDFVQTWLMQKERNMETKLKILPLFYGLSVMEFKKEERRAKWLSKWEDLAKEDPRIDVDRWKTSLGVLASFNGIVYHGGRGKKAYRDEIVEQICNEVPPDVKWDDSHVQGGSKICQVIEEAISGIQPSPQYGVRVVGVYGVGGIGKTTLCKSLGNRLFQKNDMKASHVELGSKSYGELLKEVLKDCTNINEVFVQGLDEGKCRDILLNVACKQKVFLATDNVWPNSKSLEDARKFLQLGFHKESVVLVTSRALETLTSLGISKCDCFEMPCLDDEDAMNLFLYHAAYGIQFPNENDRQAIKTCVRLCYFHKGAWNVGHYLPLALKALGIQLRCIGSCPCEWVNTLPRVRDFNYLQEEENPIFSILRSSFDCLRPIQQTLLLDLVVFAPEMCSHQGHGIGLLEWLALVHSKSLHEIEIMVLQLKKRGLVEVVDVATQSVYIHDLYREFAMLEAEGKLKDLAFEERKWVSCVETFPTELLEDCGRWKNLTRFQIYEYYDHGEESFNWIERVKWVNCSNIVVLELRELSGSLDLKGLRCLKSLHLFDVYQLDGLQDLTALNYFVWECHHPFENHSRVYIQKFPPLLKVFVLDVEVSLRNLTHLQDLRNLTHLSLTSYYNGKEFCYKLDHLPTSVRVLEICGYVLLGLGAFNGCNDLTDLALMIDDLGDHVDFEDIEDFEGNGRSYYKLGPLPLSLKILRTNIRMSFGSDVFARCFNLTELYLRNCWIESLDFRNCSSLRSLKLQDVCPDLDAMSDMSLCGLQNLRNLTDFSLVFADNVGEDFCCRIDQLPASLHVIKMSVNILLMAGVFDRCINLTKLDLQNCWIGSPDFKSCSSLQSLKIENVCPDLEAMSDWSICGLQNLRNLTDFRLVFVDDICKDFWCRMDQLPASLLVAEIGGNVLLTLSLFDQCVNLTNLKLWNFHAQSLDFGKCLSLATLELHGPLPSSLESMSDWSLWGLQELNNPISFSWSGADNHDEFYYRMGQLPTSLEYLQICTKVMLRPDVVACCPKLRRLVLEDCHAEILDFSYCSSLEYVALEKVEHLQSILGLSAASASLKDLIVDGCVNLDGIPELPNLVCLKCLCLVNLGGLQNLRLSCLSGLTKLWILHLSDSNVELREEDVCILASLPRLNPVFASVNSKIDVVRRKLVRYFGSLELEEKDLGVLPIWTNEVYKFWQ